MFWRVRVNLAVLAFILTVPFREGEVVGLDREIGFDDLFLLRVERLFVTGSDLEEVDEL